MMNMYSCCIVVPCFLEYKIRNQCLINEIICLDYRIYSIYALHPKHFVSYLSVPLNDHKVTVNHILPLAPLYNKQHKFIELFSLNTERFILDLILALIIQCWSKKIMTY
jgi:hypothetical protein